MSQSSNTFPQGSGMVPFWRGASAAASISTATTPLARPHLFDDTNGKTITVPGQEFPTLGWDPTLKAMAIAAEFAATGAAWKDHDPLDLLKESTRKECATYSEKTKKWTFTNECIAQDLDKLRGYRDLTRDGRADRHAEILTQADGFQAYFAHLLAASNTSRPATHVLVQTGYYVGGLVTAYWKLKYMRARPVQVCPNIYPVIITPPHPSFPSGHAMQAFMAAECAKLVAPSELATHMSGDVSLPSPLDLLATRIAENREYAGVHYPTDTQASKLVSAKIFPVLRCQVPSFRTLWCEAKEEWK